MLGDEVEAGAERVCVRLRRSNQLNTTGPEAPFTGHALTRILSSIGSLHRARNASLLAALRGMKSQLNVFSFVIRVRSS